jgi:hypothetical protein
MKKIIHTAILLLLILISAANLDAQKYFKIISATSVSYSGGMAQSGTGISYTVMAVLLTDDKVSFTDMWVDKSYGLPKTSSLSYSDGRKLVKGDTVVVTFAIHHYPPQSPLSKVPETAYKKPPIAMKGEGLIGFTVDNKTRYRSIDKFKNQGAEKHL